MAGSGGLGVNYNLPSESKAIFQLARLVETFVANES